MAHPGATRGGHVENQPSTHFALVAFCCLPVVLITLTLLIAGGVRAGLLIPAITSGAMIGMMIFLQFREGPER